MTESTSSTVIIRGTFAFHRFVTHMCQARQVLFTDCRSSSNKNGMRDDTNSGWKRWMLVRSMLVFLWDTKIPKTLLRSARRGSKKGLILWSYTLVCSYTLVLYSGLLIYSGLPLISIWPDTARQQQKRRCERHTSNRTKYGNCLRHIVPNMWF